MRKLELKSVSPVVLSVGALLLGTACGVGVAEDGMLLGSDWASDSDQLTMTNSLELVNSVNLPNHIELTNQLPLNNGTILNNAVNLPNSIDSFNGIDLPNGLVDVKNGLKQFVDDDPSNNFSVLVYMYQCALTQSQSVSIRYNGTMKVVNGLVGMAPTFRTGTNLDVNAKRRIGACMGARINGKGHDELFSMTTNYTGSAAYGVDGYSAPGPNRYVIGGSSVCSQASAGETCSCGALGSTEGTYWGDIFNKNEGAHVCMTPSWDDRFNGLQRSLRGNSSQLEGLFQMRGNSKGRLVPESDPDYWYEIKLRFDYRGRCDSVCTGKTFTDSAVYGTTFASSYGPDVYYNCDGMGNNTVTSFHWTNRDTVTDLERNYCADGTEIPTSVTDPHTHSMVDGDFQRAAEAWCRANSCASGSGGSSPPPSGTKGFAESCSSDSECASGYCHWDGYNNKCRPASCETATGNNVLNYGEFCELHYCGPCGVGEGDCDANNQCTTGYCQEEGSIDKCR